MGGIRNEYFCFLGFIVVNVIGVDYGNFSEFVVCFGSWLEGEVVYFSYFFKLLFKFLYYFECFLDGFFVLIWVYVGNIWMGGYFFIDFGVVFYGV